MGAADDCRNPKLSGDDGGMAGAAAAIGHDGRSALHDRLPVRVGHIGDQHVTGLHPVHLVQIMNNPGGASTDTLANAAPLYDDLGMALQFEALNAVIGAALHRFRTSLQNVKLPVLAILAPFDIHRAAVVFLDGDCLASKTLDLIIAE